jgi:hypothetical protein
MIRNIALALTIAAISTNAAAQSPTRYQTWQALVKPYQSWNDLLKPYDAKTNPDVPIAPPSSAVPLDQMPPQTQSSETALLDSCVMDAIGLLPKIEGSRVMKSSYEFRNSVRDYDFYHVLITVEFHGRQASYTYVCRVKGNEYSEVLGRQ